MRVPAHRMACVPICAALLGLIACEREQLTAPTTAKFARVSAGGPAVTIVQLGTQVGGAREISNSGVVVGDGFIWTARDGLQLLPGWEVFHPNASDVNERGDAVGAGCSAAAGRCYALFWTSAGELIELPTINVLHAVNNRGEAVGAANGAVVWSEQAGLRYLDGGFFALDINERGDVVGQAVGFRAAVWPKGGALEFLPTPAGQQSTATGINNAGEIVGFIGTHFQSTGFVWSAREGFRLVETPAGWYSHPEDINDRGDVVGWIRLAADPTLPGTQRAVLWPSAGGIVDLGGLVPNADAAAFGINNRRDIVGSSTKGVRGIVYPVFWSVGIAGVE